VWLFGLELLEYVVEVASIVGFVVGGFVFVCLGEGVMLYRFGFCEGQVPLI